LDKMLKPFSIQNRSTLFKIVELVFFCFLSLLIAGFGGCASTADIQPQVSTTAAEIPLKIPYSGTSAELDIRSELPGMLRLIGDNGSDFVTGSVTVDDIRWTPEIETDQGKVSLLQKAGKLANNFPEITNLWNMRVSDSQPFKLQIQNLQAEGHWNFSGLPITNLSAELGSAKNAFTCDESSSTTMQNCELNCGTGEAILEGILNTNCQNMRIQGGSGNLTLRFGGKELLRSLKVDIQVGAGQIDITIPNGIPARIITAGENKVVTGEGIFKSEDSEIKAYETASYKNNSGNKIEISISGGSGTINLNNS
jgi:hypothetical protein